jgi:hypothetical protein
MSEDAIVVVETIIDPGIELSPLTLTESLLMNPWGVLQEIEEMRRSFEEV